MRYAQEQGQIWTAEVVVWDNEPYYESPAIKDVAIKWKNATLRSATFFLDVDIAGPCIPFYGCIGEVKKIWVNSFPYNPKDYGDPRDKMEIDITDAIKNGLNRFKFEHIASHIPGVVSGYNVYGVVTLELEQTGEEPPEVSVEERKPAGFDPMMIVYSIIAIAGIGVVAFLISSLKK